MTPLSPSLLGLLFCIMFADSFASMKDPIKLILIVLSKKFASIVPSLPNALAAPITPAQFTAKFIPSRKLFASLIAAFTSSSAEIST